MMSSSLPPTFVEGFHDESKVKRLTYKNVLGTDMLVSNVGMGAAAFGKTIICSRSIFILSSIIGALREILQRKIGVGRSERDTPDCSQIWSERCRYSAMVRQHQVRLKVGVMELMINLVS